MSKISNYILSVGRDLGRDYDTLIRAVQDLNVSLRIVTPPYLIPSNVHSFQNVEFLFDLSYEELFEVYAQAIFVVIPLKKWAADYSSGTTSLMEAKFLGKVTICSYSAPLSEYFHHHDGVIYVDPENIPELKYKILYLLSNKDVLNKYQNMSREFNKNKYDMKVFANKLISVLNNI